MRAKMKRQDGFTLLEMIVVVAVIIVVAVAAYATMGTRPMRVYTDSAAKQIVSIIQDARLEAIRSGRNVIIQSFNQNLIEFVRDEDGNLQISDLDQVRNEIEVTGGVILAEDVGPVMFNNRGYLVNAAANPTTVNITFCPLDPEEPTQCLEKSRVARVQISVVGLPKIFYEIYTGS